LEDAINTGDIFYDPITSFAWYSYNAQVPPIPSQDVDASTTSTTTATTAKQQGNSTVTSTSFTIGRVCAIDIGTGRGTVMEPCQEIAPKIGAATSTMIQSVQACTDPTNDGSIVSLAVIVHDTVQFLQFTNVVGSRLVVYQVGTPPSSSTTSSTNTSSSSSTGGAGAGVSTRQLAPLDVPYEDWTSLYGEPTISGRPTFSSDCAVVYATYITNPKLGAGSTITIATSVIGRTGTDEGEDRRSRELWRHEEGDNNFRRFVGLAPSLDGTTLYSATHVGKNPVPSAMGVFALDAVTGAVVQQYLFRDGKATTTATTTTTTTNTNATSMDAANTNTTTTVPPGTDSSTSTIGDGDDSNVVFNTIDDSATTTLQLHNGHTNLVVDARGDIYHIDNILGLMKFSGLDLTKGPMWQARKGEDDDEDLMVIRKKIRRHHRTRVLMPEGYTRNVNTQNVSTILYNDNIIPGSGEENTLGFQPTAVYSPADAYRPALDPTSTTIYSSGNTNGRSNRDGRQEDSQVVVTAISTTTGDPIWQTPLLLRPSSSSDGSSKNIFVTDDTKVGPCTMAPSGFAVYTSTRSGVQCQDAMDGTILWTYPLGGDDDDDTTSTSTPVSRLVIVSADNVLIVAPHGGAILSLDTTGEPILTVSPAATPTPTPTSAASPPSLDSDRTLEPVNGGDDDDDDDDDDKDENTNDESTLPPIQTSGATMIPWSSRCICSYFFLALSLWFGQ
jgi:hypothetical protein